jgi:hypothetical protein
MDKVFSIGAAILLGGLFLFSAWLISGGFDFFEGQQSLRLAVTQLGGPAGAWGGTLLILAIAAAVYWVHEKLNFFAGRKFVETLKGRGFSDEVIAARIEAMPLSRGLKKRLKMWMKESNEVTE